jgi:hypothetical protein
MLGFHIKVFFEKICKFHYVGDLSQDPFLLKIHAYKFKGEILAMHTQLDLEVISNLFKNKRRCVIPKVG